MARAGHGNKPFILRFGFAALSAAPIHPTLAQDHHAQTASRFASASRSPARRRPSPSTRPRRLLEGALRALHERPSSTGTASTRRRSARRRSTRCSPRTPKRPMAKSAGSTSIPMSTARTTRSPSSRSATPTIKGDTATVEVTFKNFDMRRRHGLHAGQGSRRLEDRRRRVARAAPIPYDAQGHHVGAARRS